MTESAVRRMSELSPPPVLDEGSETATPGVGLAAGVGVPWTIGYP